MNFSTLQGLNIPEGVVTQIARDGVVLWKLQTEEPNKPIILEVEKITANTYAGETTYIDEQFIVLDIYPKTNGTVNITYGGLTKTITDTSGAEEPNAQQVFFGTFNGVSDSVTTPTSGTLTIEGDYCGIACGSYMQMSKAVSTYHYNGVNKIVDFGSIVTILNSAFYGCSNLVLEALPSEVVSIGEYAFSSCSNLVLTSLPNTVTSIGKNAFYYVSQISIDVLPNNLQYLGDKAFYIQAEGDSSAGFDYTRSILSFPSLPTGLTYIGSYASAYNESLSVVEGLNNLTAIGEQAFVSCPNLTKVVIGDEVTSIGDNAFEYCRKLVEITIGRNVTEIGKYAFRSGLDHDDIVLNITFLSSTPPTIGNAIFGHVQDDTAITIKVPAGSGDAYKEALYNTRPSSQYSTHSDYSVFVVEEN